MPAKERKRRRGSASFNLHTLEFMERFSLWCGQWESNFRDIISRKAMIDWYLANREVFDAIQQPGDTLKGHRPGERHAGWWYTTAFSNYGPRLVVDAECAEQAIQGHTDGWLVPPAGCTDDDEQIAERWKRGDMPREVELQRLHSVSVPMRDFPDGWETSIQYLERHQLIASAERAALATTP